MAIFFSFLILGLIIGSFLNVIVYRVHDAETLLGRSFCRHCKKQVHWYDNIPLISFILLWGQCRACQGKISWQYPAFELLTGVLFGLAGSLFSPLSQGGSWLPIGWLLGIISILLVIAVYDLRYMEIPLIVLIIGSVWTLGYLLTTWQPGANILMSRLGLGVLGGLTVAVFFFALVYASHETWMGWGDVWLGGLAGLIVGLPAVLFMLTLSFGSGAAVGLILIAFSKKHMKSQIPFAPYLVIGVLLVLLLPRISPPVASLFLF